MPIFIFLDDKSRPKTAFSATVVTASILVWSWDCVTDLATPPDECIVRYAI